MTVLEVEDQWFGISKRQRRKRGGHWELWAIDGEAMSGFASSTVNQWVRVSACTKADDTVRRGMWALAECEDH